MKIDSRKKNQKDAVPALCRRLIVAGHDPAVRVHITRNGDPVWRTDKALGDWAGIDIWDKEAGRITSEKYRSFPEALKGR